MAAAMSPGVARLAMRSSMPIQTILRSCSGETMDLAISRASRSFKPSSRAMALLKFSASSRRNRSVAAMARMMTACMSGGIRRMMGRRSAVLGNFSGGNHVLDQIQRRRVQLRQLFRAEGEHETQRAGQAAGLAHVVDDGVAMVGLDDEGQQVFGLPDQFFIERVVLAGDDDLLHQRRQALRENHVRRFGGLVLVVMQQFAGEGKPQEGVLLRPRGFGGGPALLDFAVQRREFISFGGDGVGVLLEQRLEIILERQHDFLRLRMRIVLRVGRDVLEENQRRLAEFLDDAFARHLAFYKSAVGADKRRGMEFVRLLQQGLQQPGLERRFQLDQFLDGGFQEGGEVALGFFEDFQNHGLKLVVVHFALGQRRANLVDLRVVLHQPGNDHADVVDGQLGHERW